MGGESEGGGNLTEALPSLTGCAVEIEDVNEVETKAGADENLN